MTTPADKPMPSVAPAPSPPTTPTATNDFAAQSEGRQPGLLAELVDFLWHYKLWWLTPVVVVLLLVGLLIFLSGTAAAPFIYPLF